MPPVRLLKVSVPVPVFVMVTVCAADGDCRPWLPKANVAGDNSAPGRAVVPDLTVMLPEILAFWIVCPGTRSAQRKSDRSFMLGNADLKEEEEERKVY
jgi:hypothetical protein